MEMKRKGVYRKTADGEWVAFFTAPYQRFFDSLTGRQFEIRSISAGRWDLTKKSFYLPFCLYCGKEKNFVD